MRKVKKTEVVRISMTPTLKDKLIEYCEDNFTNMTEVMTRLLIAELRKEGLLDEKI